MSLDVTGLTAGQTYHFRAVVASSLGVACGEDVTFISVAIRPTINSATRPSPGSLLIQGTGEAGANHILEVSTNFLKWEWRADITPDALGRWHFLEAITSLPFWRFYRVKTGL